MALQYTARSVGLCLPGESVYGERWLRGVKRVANSYLIIGFGREKQTLKLTNDNRSSAKKGRK